MGTIGTVTSIVQAATGTVQAVAGTVQAVSQAYEAFGDNVKGIHDRTPKCVIKRNGPDINDFGTLRNSLKKILDSLTNEFDVNRIGIHGIPGIGKTTIMENLNDHDRVAQMFDIVIWLDVSEEEGEGNFSTKKLQQAIAGRLNLTKKSRNPDEVARRITEELMGKKYLLLLDDVKDPLELREIGIPDSNGSKIVLTTRNRLVCRGMKLDKEIKVEHLTTNEAWEMFKVVLGNKDISEHPRISRKAFKVCQECYGIPRLITKVAPTFRLKTDPILWNGLLDDWRTWPDRHIKGIREFYEMMRFCYKDLKDERSQKCFLYCALYPKGSDIYTDSLLACWEAEDLLVNENDARTECVNVGYTILFDLQDVSLLEKGRRDYHVTMDKFIRQVALYISEDVCKCKHLVKINKKQIDPPHEESWSEKSRISLVATELNRLPPSPNCSMLSTLFLQENEVLKEIPPEFFKHMIELRVLDLSNTGITSLPLPLPSSLRILCKLKVLHLNNCKDLVELPSTIDRLENLEFLDIHGSGINRIPADIKRLTHLKHLWVSFGNGNDAQGTSFDYNVISELSKLEELVIDFEEREQWTNDVAGNIIKEVAKLENFKKLRVSFPEMIVDVIEVVAYDTVCINVPEARNLLSYIRESWWKEVKRITSFQFFIGLDLKNRGLDLKTRGYCQHSNFVKYEKYVKYCNGVASSNPANTPILDPILEVLAEAEGLELVGHKDIKPLSKFGTNMNKIQGFLIERCDAMETIIDTAGSQLLPNLDVLIIKNLGMLKRIWEGHGCQASKLTTLVISDCPLLAKIFPPGVIQQLCGIKYLTIEKCAEVKEIFPRADAPVLPNLKELILLRMTKLKSISTMPLRLSSLEKLKIFECPDVRILPFNKGDVKKLECIEAEEDWWSALKWRIWPEQEDKEELQKLCSFRSRNDKDTAL